jgi:cytochrome P450
MTEPSCTHPSVANDPAVRRVTIEQLAAAPHPELARLRTAGPVTWVPSLEAWVVTGWEVAVQVLRDPETFTVDDPRFSTAQVVGPSMLSLDGAEHQRHRRPFTAPFRPRRVTARFGTFVEAETDRLLDQVADDGRAELRAALAGPLATAVVAESLGLDGTDPAVVVALLGWYRAIVDSVSGISAGDAPSDAGRHAFAQLHRAVTAHLGAAGGTSLLGEAAGGGTLSNEEIVSNAGVLMFGGIETTEGMILNAVWHLLTNHDQLAAVRADRTLVADAVEESLRLEPAAAIVDRYATRDVNVGGAEIVAGDKVTVSLAGANRDAAVFAEPDRFDIHRPERHRHLAFAQGPHLCVGMDLARLETNVAIDRLLTRFPGLRLDVTDGDTAARGKIAPRGLVFRKPTSLRVRW